MTIRLDSSHPDPALNWSASGLRVCRLLRCHGRTQRTTLETARGIERQWDRPLEALAWMEQSARETGDGRWIGYFSYDLGRLFEDLPARVGDDDGLPLFVFGYCGAADQPLVNKRPSGERRATAMGWSFPRQAYLRAVRRVIDYIEAGDIFQVNLSQRWTTPLTEEPETIYRRLIGQTPAWYGAFLDFGDHALLCNSPELFLDVRPDPGTGSRRVVTRPIKGTRPRHDGMERELQHSIKDEAELNMIVDLERNDLGRVCQIGSVKVSQRRMIETHPTVYHGAASVEGQLRPEVGLVDLLRATFPGGSITGAPKIRAMQIIDELEPTRRGPYCGAIGYLAGDGSMRFNIAIRTMIVAHGQVHVPVGGGIVADSVPEEEHEETLVKARALLSALQAAT